MATWKSKGKFYFDTDHTRPIGEEKAHFVWEYNTTSDYLTIRRILVECSDAYMGDRIERQETEWLFEADEAKALLKALQAWAEDMK